VKGDDLVVGTHGRSFWILDDVTPLRQLSADVASAGAHLFTPQTAYRVQRSKATDTPLPPEEPSGENPPAGAILSYVLKAAPKTPVTLEILDASGTVLRRFASDEKPAPLDDDVAVPQYWMRAPRILAATPGMHRFVWDLHLPPPAALEREYPISAVPHDTPKEPLGPAVLPGSYTVRLTVDGASQSRPLTVKMDPRVKASRQDLERRFALAMRLAAALRRDADALASAKARGADTAALTRLNSELTTLYRIVEGADAAPTSQVEAAVEELERRLAEPAPAGDEKSAAAAP